MDDSKRDVQSEKVAELARLVGCFTDVDVATLAGVKNETLEAWRKRGQGPAYIRLGCNYLYPVAAVSAHLQTLIRERGNTGRMKGML